MSDILLSPLEGPRPDVMNDPQYATNTSDGEDGMGEPDTCRICRAEGADSESLFHPCKCSGSIKYVHQDCLMEWLSHSQKKHCELCKTPFRFTKLYSPNMPQSLPFHLLVRHIFIHIVKNLGTWLRFALVVFVWLGCLPYVIRQIWKLLFWFSDGGWPINQSIAENQLRSAAANQTLEAAEALRGLLQTQISGNATSPVMPHFAAQTTPAKLGRLIEKITQAFMPVAQALGNNSSDIFVKNFLKTMLSNDPGQELIPQPEIQNLSTTILGQSAAPLTPTLLSEFQFLKKLTRNPHINQLVISIAEGYVITILVVVCFILIFLIREWVVQQQPGINMGAGFNAEFAQAERPLEQGLANDEVREVAQRPIARPRRRNRQPENVDDQMRQLLFEPLPVTPETDNQPDIAGQNRPSPVRDALSPAAEIQRRLTEEPRFTEEFLAIWRRAEGDPDEVLRIIEDEDRGDEMRYWVNSMKVLQNPSRQGSTEHSERSASPIQNGPASVPPHAWSSQQGRYRTSSTDSLRAQASNSQTGSDDSEIFPLPDSIQQADIVPRSGLQEPVVLDRKGKERASEETHNPSWPAIFSSSSGTRPRAVSDGPQPNQGLSPLANNSWTFSNLPDTAENMELRLPRDRTTKTQIDHLSPSRIIPPKLVEFASEGDAWKTTQNLRVQRAIEKGREFQALTNQSELSLNVSLDQSESEEPFEITRMDGVVRTMNSWDEEFENHPFSESDSHEDAHTEYGEAEVNPFEEDTPLPAPREPIPAPPPGPRGLIGSIADFLWGGVGDDTQQLDLPGNDEHIVHDLAEEAPFVAIPHLDNFDQEEEVQEQDRDVVDAAIAAGIDPNEADAIEDGEDFEGIMELIGMRGPIFSLFQNAIFSAFLLALTVSFGVWIPYNIGRISLLLAGNPGAAFKIPLKAIFVCAAFIQDLALSLLGALSYVILLVLAIPLRVWNLLRPSVNDPISSTLYEVGSTALQLSQDALNRVLHGILDTVIHFTESDIFAFSAASHESLINLRTFTVNTATGFGSSIAYVFTGNYTLIQVKFLVVSKIIVQNATEIIRAVPSVLAKPENWVISLESPKRSFPLDLGLSVWSSTDRFWAVVAGYASVCIAGALYVRKGTPFSSGQVARDWEATIIDLLNQAGGVLKVILIISIEMLVFPLYCGLLLDAALLPLFDNASMLTRISFTCRSPFTSIFVHWFVGTCYMFHFALFVSMCRKIMRKGVLYFIRDPDDPTFHPVRDVLERNVATQLRKILFSALVYGALVVICLGGVVWGLAFAFHSILPIHWSSNELVLEFPIDLLFYNFLMPLAVRFFKPSEALHSMYSWWFRRSARMLRITWFMFDERNIDEEGYYVRRNWSDIFSGNEDPENIIESKDITAPFVEDPDLHVYFRRDGRYVRAPASDQVRIPKGSKIFLQVDADNKRIDGQIDQPDGIHGSANSLYKHLYVPPHFRLRIFTFIFSIWIFAAFTGVSITVVPLVFGRYVFATIIPPHVRKNDVYAFSIGIYILGSALYMIWHMRTFIKYVKESLTYTAATPDNVLRRAVTAVSFVVGIIWTYTAFLFILPTLFAAVVEFYFMVPLHTYFFQQEQHVVHFVQSWTMGLLYVKLTTRYILWHEHSRQAQALRAITRNGYLNPDAKLATRSFILPAGIIALFLLIAPSLIANAFIVILLKDKPELHILAHRYAYPLYLCFGGVILALLRIVNMLKQWRMMIRDEVYLIGERLHNFGDRKSTTVPPPSLRRIET